MTSSRRTNEPRPLEVEPSTAGASGGGDLDGCPDCGRNSCTGEECYWPDEAELRYVHLVPVNESEDEW